MDVPNNAAPDLRETEQQVIPSISADLHLDDKATSVLRWSSLIVGKRSIKNGEQTPRGWLTLKIKRRKLNLTGVEETRCDQNLACSHSSTPQKLCCRASLLDLALEYLRHQVLHESDNRIKSTLYPNAVFYQDFGRRL